MSGEHSDGNFGGEFVVSDNNFRGPRGGRSYLSPLVDRRDVGLARFEGDFLGLVKADAVTIREDAVNRQVVRLPPR